MTYLKEKDKQKAAKKGERINKTTQPVSPSCVIYVAIRNYLFLLMPILPQAFFTLMG